MEKVNVKALMLPGLAIGQEWHGVQMLFQEKLRESSKPLSCHQSIVNELAMSCGKTFTLVGHHEVSLNTS